MLFNKESKRLYKEMIFYVPVTQYFQSALGVCRYGNENFVLKTDMQSVNLDLHNYLM